MDLKQNVMEIEGSPIQIVEFNKSTNKYELNSELQNILCSDEVRNCSIAVISIVGALRKGKSFLLSFFLRYLQAEYVCNNSKNWMGTDDIPLLGFKWRSGSERETTGIWIWSKIFTKVLSNGEKIGVMLMDSQGIFDNDTEMDDNVLLFSLSTMLSSVQIYNLFNNLQEDDLHYLQLFTEYGKISIDKTSEKSFQKLYFLVRDWNYPSEHNFGAEGGNQYLNKRLKLTNNKSQEQFNVRNALESNFDQTECFLMPHPGRYVTDDSSFNGKLKDIDHKFKEMLNVLVPSILAPEMVVLKKINGKNICAEHLVHHIDSYWKTYNKIDVITPQTIYKVTVDTNILSAKDHAKKLYTEEISRQTIDSNDYLEVCDVFKIHNDAFKGAIDLFNRNASIGDEDLQTKHRIDLETWIWGQLMFYITNNENKKTKKFEEGMKNLSVELRNKTTIIEDQAELIRSLESSLTEFKNYNNKKKQEIETLKSSLSDKDKHNESEQEPKNVSWLEKWYNWYNGITNQLRGERHSNNTSEIQPTDIKKSILSIESNKLN